MGVQAFSPEAAVEGLYEGVVGRIARPGEVERNALRVGPEIEVAAYELAALIDPDRLRIACLGTDPLQRGDDVFSPIAEARGDHWREAREGVDHRQRADRFARGELVVDEVVRPEIVRPRPRRPVAAPARTIRR